ncbi:MAG: flagellar basal-body MS-ring/collar protein FliF [Nitrospirota bacterium]
MPNMNTVADQVKVIPFQKKIALLVVAALVIAAVILLVSWFQKADYQLLFSNLSQEDGGAIIQKLSELQVPYRTEGGGIMVPADKVYELRLQLASQGLPQGGGIGFELFDKTSFTMTDFVQKLNYRRALQGELARTIRALSEIDQCRVHLAVPEKSLFAKKDDRPKASVFVKLKPGRKLLQVQVQGIVHLVSSSVEGLDSRDVTVVNNNGEMLTTVVDEHMAMTSGQLEYQRGYEKDLETRVVTMLEPVIGKGKIRARVALALDFTKTEKTEEKFDPDSQVVRSEQRTMEKSSSGSPAGVPGVGSNLPDKTPAGAQQNRAAHSEKKNDTVNYEINKVVNRVVTPTGEIKRISAVVLVDGTYTGQSGSKETKYVPRSEEAIQQFEDMVKKAVGFVADRGDEVKVVNMPFEVAQQEEMSESDKAAAGTPILPMIMSFGKYIFPLLAGVVLFFLVIKPIMKTLMTPSALSQTAAYQLPAQPLPELEQSATAIKNRQGRDQLVDWAKKNPSQATNLVKGWLEDK